MTEPGSPRSSNAKRLLLIALVLLVVAVAVNYRSVMEIIRGERTLKGVIYGLTRGGDTDFAGFDMPDDVGSEDAKVRVEVFLRAGDPCHIESVFLGQALGLVDPERILVDFQDTSDAEVLKRFAELKIGCEQGMAVNGKTKFKVPMTDESGKKTEKTVYFTAEGHYTLPELHAVLDKELKETYDGEGLARGPDEFVERLPADIKRLREEALEAAKQKQQDKE